MRSVVRYGSLGAVRALLRLGADKNIVERTGREFLLKGDEEFREAGVLRSVYESCAADPYCDRKRVAHLKEVNLRDARTHIGRGRWLMRRGGALLQAAGWSQDQIDTLPAEARAASHQQRMNVLMSHGGNGG